jgi:4-amino-4-deoxy-L-arabinose transferase-like glycosyltransferase
MRFTAVAALATIIIVGFATHAIVITYFPIQKTLGDEASYTLEAHRILDTAATNLVPGHMIFHHRPPLGFSYFALYAQPELIRNPQAQKWIIDRPHDTWSQEMGRFVQRVSFSNLCLLSIATILIFLLCRECGFGQPASLLAAALMMLNPRTGFYVQSIWPEILHLTLLLASFWAFALALRKEHDGRIGRMLGWLLLCGVLLGYARLTRGVVGPFVWVMAALAAWFVFRSRSPRTQNTRAGWSLLAAVVLLMSFHATLLPQQIANRQDHGMPLIGHNTWRNIEGGIGRTADYPAQYMNAAPDPMTREQLAKQRILTRVLDRPFSETLAQQTSVFFWRLGYSYVDRGFTVNRWGGRGAGIFFARATTLFSWTIFVAGLLGLAFRGFGSRAGATLSLFTLYYVAGLFIVIPNTRMFIQLVPLLLIFTAGALDGTIRLVSNRQEFRSRLEA